MFIEIDTTELASLDAAVQHARTGGPYEICLPLNVSKQLDVGDNIEIADREGATQMWGTVSSIADRRVSFELWKYFSPSRAD